MAQPPFPPAKDRPPLGFVLTEYPFPIAVAYSRFHRELDRQDPVAAAWQLLDAFQGTLKFCACVAAADLLRAEPDGPDAARLVERLFKPLSLGDWQSILEDALRPLRDPVRRSARRVGDLYTVFFRPTNGQYTDVARKLFAGEPTLVQWRNGVFGHGVFRHDRAFYAAEVNRLRPVLDELLTALRPVLSAWRLVGRTPGGDDVDWTGAGDTSPGAPHAHQPWGDPLPLLLAPRSGGDGLELGPLLTVQQCLVCRQPAAFFFEGNEPDKKKNTHRTFFIEYFAGHGQERKNWAEARKLANRLPPGFEWERASYDWKAAAQEVERLFRSFDDEYRRPEYLLDAFWAAADGGPRGYIHLVGLAGTGKSYLVQGLQQDARDRGEKVLVYHILAGQLSDYRAFVSELADRAKEQLNFRAQEIQTRVARLTDLAEQMAAFLSELMRANGLSRLIVAIDGLDELREPEKPGGALISDFLPPADRLPDGCFILLTSRPELRPAVRERLDRLRTQNLAAFHELSLQPDGEANRELLRAYLRDKLPEPFRTPEIVEEVLRRSGGVFLYAFHLSRALASGAFTEAGSLPEGGQFYPAYLARLREQVGEQEYEQVYLRTLLLLVAARQPVLPEQLARWGVRRDRVPLVLQDLADFLRLVKGRRWHESFNDDGDNRYELAHETLVRFVQQDAGMAEQLWQAHAAIADAAQSRHEGRWKELDPYDDADLYDLRFLATHVSVAGTGLQTLPLDYVKACFEFGAQAGEGQRYVIAVHVFEHAVAILRLVVQSGRPELEEDLAANLYNLGAVLSPLERQAEAANANREASGIFRRLVESGRADLEDRLAMTLNNLGGTLCESNQPKEGVAACGEAIVIFRRIMQAGHPELEDCLARSLNTLGIGLHDLRQTDAAIDCYREAIATYRVLTQSGYAEAEPYLAHSLNYLGAELSDGGRSAEAEAAFREAEIVIRRLLESGRFEVEELLATVLRNMGSVLDDIGRRTEAVAALREAVAIFRRLVLLGRSELERNLADCLSILGIALRHVPLVAESVAAHEEAVAIRRRLVQSGRVELERRLAASLTNLGIALGDVPLLTECIAAHKEAVAIRRRLLQPGLAETEDNLADALMNLGYAQRDACDASAALSCFDEALHLRRRCVERGERELLPALVGSEWDRFSLLCDQNNWTGAAAAVHTMLRRLISLFPSGQLPNPVRQKFRTFTRRTGGLNAEDRRALYKALGDDLALVHRVIFGRVI